MNIQNTKSVLAKLLATENLDVIHQTNLSTASFDPVNRKLYLPQWKNITNDVYDLFVCHEVAHALYTPAEGWHNSIHELGMGFKSFLNVVEDCRIEKLIKLKYLGARSSMYRGYQHLVHELDFFGIKKHNIDVNTLPLIDRINIYYKSSGYDQVVFDDDEYKFIEQIDQASTFEEVLDIAKSLYQYAKEHEEETENTINFDELSIENPYLLDDDYDEDDDELDDSFNEIQIESNSKEANEKSEEENPLDKHFEQEQDDNNESQSEDSRASQSGGHFSQSKPNLDPKSLTDQIYRIKESDIVDDRAKPIRYLTFPEPLLENIIVDKDDIHHMMEIVNKRTSLTERGTRIVDTVIKKLHHDNKAFISHMIKEFEMRKKASDYKRTTVARTGVLDLTDVYKYKYSEDLFRKIGITKDGKKHGFVMVVDWSGSMSDSLFGAFQQLFVLMTFCRRVNIPFEVYSFTDYNVRVEKGVDGTETVKNEDPGWHYTTTLNNEMYFKPAIGDLAIEDLNHPLKLIKWFDSSWTATQFKHQLRLFTMAVCQSSSFRYGDSKFNDYVQAIIDEVGVDWYGGITSELGSSKNWVPYSQLGGTPLNTTLLALPILVEKFKVKHSVEINSVIILTDGESAGRLGVIGPSRNSEDKFTRHLVSTRGHVVYAVDKDTKEHYDVKDEYGYCLTDLLVTYVKKKTGSNLINFFISNGGNIFHYGTYDWKDSLDTLTKRKEIAKKEMRQNGFYLGTARAYDRTFVIRGSSHLQTDDDDSFTIKEGASNRVIASTLIKHNKNKNQKRILLTNFVDLVS